MPRKDANKPKGRMTAYAFFIQTCRDEHKKKHPQESVNFSEFSKKCSEKWKTMTGKDKKRFDEMSAKDKVRYEREMADYVPAGGEAKGKRKKKDPNAPKRALSAFFLFCSDERPGVRAEHPDWSVGEVAKALGKMWEECTDRKKYDELHAKAKLKYEKELAAYKKKGGASSPKKSKKQVEPEEDEEDEEEDEEEEEDDEEEDDE